MNITIFFSPIFQIREVGMNKEKYRYILGTLVGLSMVQKILVRSMGARAWDFASYRYLPPLDSRMSYIQIRNWYISILHVKIVLEIISNTQVLVTKLF